MKSLFYTFRTFPHIEKIPSTFVFGKLKEDFEKFSSIILKEKPDIIIGIAHSHNGLSRFETIAVNQFNGNKKVNKYGPRSISLYFPENKGIDKSEKYTDSFCNWTAYKISEFVRNNNLNVKVSFVHITEVDLDKIISLPKSL